MSVYAVVLAGGSGSRMGGEENKVFLSLRGVPAIVRAIAPFSALCDGIVLVARDGEQERLTNILRKYGVEKLVDAMVCGGEDRQASVANGLAALPTGAEIVLVHDGARALVTEAVVQRTIASVRAHGSGIASIPITDTVKRADEGGQVLETLNRQALFAMQTPQGFKVELLREAHRVAREADYHATDDAALLEYAGLPVYLCQGDPENIKLTTPMDQPLAELLLQQRAERAALS